MGDERKTGLPGALQLDEKAAELADEIRDQGEETVQHELFQGSSVFGEITTPDGQKISGGAGRPKGSRSKSTKDLVKLIEATGRHPLLAMAEIVATPIDVIARTLGCKKIEAAEYHRKVMNDLAPYVAQRLPTAIEIPGANAGVLIINMGAPHGENPSLDQVFGRVLDHAEQVEENQALSGDEDGPAHDEPAHEEGK